jgi:catechol 2,3-dioxygenase-like lactoylglutathione lyase family enzyme
MFRIKGLDSVDILTNDVPRMVKFYHETLTIPFYIPWDGDEELASLDLGNIVICLMRTRNEIAPPHHAMNFTTDPPGFDSIAFKVDDLDAAFAALDGKVKWVRKEPFEMSDSNGSTFRNYAIHDPDGNMVYIQESTVIRTWTA